MVDGVQTLTTARRKLDYQFWMSQLPDIKVRSGFKLHRLFDAEEWQAFDKATGELMWHYEVILAPTMEWILITRIHTIEDIEAME